MKIGFAGDLVLQNIQNSPHDVFGDISSFIAHHNINLCINLESPVISKGMASNKKKITLNSHINGIRYLKLIKPYLINLSNNHINDYGNPSILLTEKLLNENNLRYWGVGYSFESENIYINHINKFVLISFTDESSDTTKSMLFNDPNNLGPYCTNTKLVSKISQNYPNYRIIINIHWGKEDVLFPPISIRDLGRLLIDCGADLIIGHHPHRIQPVEKYNGKFIFYSIGNFYFNDIVFWNGRKNIYKKALKHQKEGIIPIFNIYPGKIEFASVIRLKIKNNRLFLNENGSVKYLNINYNFYKRFYFIYNYFYKIEMLIMRIFRKINLLVGNV